MLEDAYTADGSADRDHWCIDNWDAVCAHIGAVQRITSAAASAQLLVALAVPTASPRSGPCSSTDSSTTRRSACWSPAPAAHRTRRATRTRRPPRHRPADLHHVAIPAATTPRCPDRRARPRRGAPHHLPRQGPPGQHHLRRTERHRRTVARMFIHDAQATEDRLDALADTVCPHDPRTREQRRADAISALAAGTDRLTCLCPEQDCPAAQNPPPSPVIIHLVAHLDPTTQAPPPRPDPRGTPARTRPTRAGSLRVSRVGRDR